MDFGVKKLTFIRDYSQKLFGVGSVHILCEAVFTAFLAFGYVFTVIKEHYGEKPAGVFSIIIYLVYTEIRLYDFIDPVLREGWPVNPFEFINFLSLLLVGDVMVWSLIQVVISYFKNKNRDKIING